MGASTSTDCITLFGKARKKNKFTSVPITEDEFDSRGIGLEDSTNTTSAYIIKIDQVIGKIQQKRDFLEEKIKGQRLKLNDLKQHIGDPHYKQEIQSKMRIYKMTIAQKERIWKTIENLEVLKINLENAGSMSQVQAAFGSVHSAMDTLVSELPKEEIKKKLDEIEGTMDEMKDLNHVMNDMGSKLSEVDDYDLETELAEMLEEPKKKEPVVFPIIPATPIHQEPVKIGQKEGVMYM